MFRIEIIDHIKRFNFFPEMRHHMRLENIKNFFCFFIQEFVLAENVFQNIYSKQCIL